MKPRAGRGALIIIALLFASSGALRIGDGLGLALAEASGESHAAAKETMAPETPVECPLPPAELAAALSDRESRLAAAEAAIADREAALALADQAITLRLTDLQTAEEDLRKTLSIADGAAEEDITRLVTVYEAMKPKDAATLFDAMEAEFAAGFLGRMRPDAAAAVMAGMAPERAYAVSAIMAGRNALVPKE
jgi:flagellar motility protein MotE (MotC chaperone)